MTEDTFVEKENEAGFPQYYQVCSKTGDEYPVCIQCKSMVLPNRGQGMICDKCDREFSLECEKDYY